MGKKREKVRNYLNYSSGSGLGPIKLKSLHGRSGDGVVHWETSNGYKNYN